ncbi:unnamed protein product [Didymodactylos carnosus]|uniref:DUF7164 domain-containing protein n=1 Tax=Didymodactylos carnosus TaxID=1234261 RepID=A0A813QLV7_9BILA|nr:unnamed protein product [Didymodactylos carnosus]CAF1103746.1 unnamed protein product [Didymodactylos carnosus]CAF3550811.1 unnamed protein product [Didymodactylos carnosus]CAF3865596.1 unnamed protein product [Didymodactylos carnosus]
MYKKQASPEVTEPSPSLPLNKVGPTIGTAIASQIVSTITETTRLVINTTIPSVVIPSSNLSNTHFCSENRQESDPVQRAVLTYYPYHQEEYFFPEIRWLYRSWLEMMLDEPDKWRTDLVIFTYKFSAAFKSLNCINEIRKDVNEPPRCRIILYIPITLRNDNNTKNNFENAFADERTSQNNTSILTIPHVFNKETFNNDRSISLYRNLRTYGYIDSINAIYEGYSTFQMYDYVLRTDIDIFITRNFSKYVPDPCILLTGGGGYGTDYNRRKLRRIAKDMELMHLNISGMGSTWYGPPYSAYLIANLTLDSMLYLAINEFSGPERDGKVGTILWPEWHYGVLLLYGQHLAINHLVAQRNLSVRIAHEMLDQSTTNNDTNYMKQNLRLVLHCWHTDVPFSKFAFKMGHYNKTDPKQFIDKPTAQAYAMRIAIESRLMSLEQLGAKLKEFE